MQPTAPILLQPLFADGPHKVSDEDLAARYAEIKAIWARFLQPKKIRLPSLDSLEGLSLVYLADGYPETRPVSKDEATTFVRFYKPKTNDLQAIRHLSTQAGFWIAAGSRAERASDGAVLRNGWYQLLTLEETYTNWDSARRVESGDWDEIKRAYANRCATCGSEEGRPNLQWPTQTTTLQKGHMNPMEPLGPGNLIPQCSPCNKAYLSHFIFDDRGRTVSIADPVPVIKAPERVRRAVYEILAREFDR